MNEHSISQNKRDAELQLLAAKEVLLDLASKISGEYTTVDQLNNIIWKNVKDIDAMLEGEE